jgi:hypothetical protein
MSQVIIAGDTSGTITLQAPAVSGSTTLTLPAATGTVMVSGNMPAFSAYGSSATSLTNNGYTKVAFQTKEFDTASCYDNSTNYRFTPTVAGYYQVNAGVAASFTTGESTIYIYKNGSRFKNGQDNGALTYQVNIASLIYLNGSTDYIEIYVYQGTGVAINTSATLQSCWFQASMVRSA